jgi:hypothetical protein
MARPLRIKQLDARSVQVLAHPLYRLTMTPPQLRSLMQELQEVVLRHREVAEDTSAGDHAAAADGDGPARPVWLLMYAFPAGDGT